MAYRCPRCGAAVQRGSNTMAGVAGGLVGAMIVAAFGSFKCKACGTIPRSEFAPDVRRKMMIGSVTLGVTALVLFLGVIILLVYMQTRR